MEHLVIGMSLLRIILNKILIDMEDQFNSEQEYQDFETPTPQRPSGLTIWCVLSFINAGWQFLTNIIPFLAFNVMQRLSQDEDYLELLEKYGIDSDMSEQAFGILLSVGRIYYLLVALLFVGSFIGVYHMWYQRKKGFHVYAISQILILIVMALFGAASSMVGPVILTALWIGVYYLYYRRFKQ